MRVLLGAYFLVTGVVVAVAAASDVYHFLLWGFWGQPPDWQDRVLSAEAGGLILVVAGITCLVRPRAGVLFALVGSIPPWWLYGPPLSERGWWLGFPGDPHLLLLALVPPVLLLGVPVVGCIAGWIAFMTRQGDGEGVTPPDADGK